MSATTSTRYLRDFSLLTNHIPNAVSSSPNITSIRHIFLLTSVIFFSYSIISNREKFKFVSFKSKGRSYVWRDTKHKTFQTNWTLLIRPSNSNSIVFCVMFRAVGTALCGWLHFLTIWLHLFLCIYYYNNNILIFLLFRFLSLIRKLSTRSWSEWTPERALRMHRKQIEICTKGISLLKVIFFYHL